MFRTIFSVRRIQWKRENNWLSLTIYLTFTLLYLFACKNLREAKDRMKGGKKGEKEFWFLFLNDSSISLNIVNFKWLLSERRILHPHFWYLQQDVTTIFSSKPGSRSWIWSFITKDTSTCVVYIYHESTDKLRLHLPAQPGMGLQTRQRENTNPPSFYPF